MLQLVRQSGLKIRYIRNIVGSNPTWPIMSNLQEVDLEID